MKPADFFEKFFYQLVSSISWDGDLKSFYLLNG